MALARVRRSIVGQLRSIWVIFSPRNPLNTILSEAQAGGEHCLRRALGALNLVTLGIGAIIGAGIFITGQAAAQFAGPAIVISFVLAGIACAFAGLCYSEFASMIPIVVGRQKPRVFVAGSCREFARVPVVVASNVSNA